MNVMHHPRVIGIAAIVAGTAILLFLLFSGSRTTELPPRVWVRGIPFRVEIADSLTERVQGLQGRTSLPVGEGMLFIFSEKTIPDFWMKNTLIPLDILWIADGAIVDITFNAQPEPSRRDDELQRYRPRVPIDHVLEFNAGVARSFGFSIGDPIRVQ